MEISESFKLAVCDADVSRALISPTMMLRCTLEYSFMLCGCVGVRRYVETSVIPTLHIQNSARGYYIIQHRHFLKYQYPTPYVV